MSLYSPLSRWHRLLWRSASESGRLRWPGVAVDTRLPLTVR